MTTQESTGRLFNFPQPFGKYTLVSHLATGGMAYVFLARQTGMAGFEKECVIKRILPHLGENQEFLRMFLDEARIVARLSHPNIVQIFDLGQVNEDFFLAMEYIDGCDLAQLLQRAQEQGAPAVPWPLATRMIADAAAGLAHAHQATDSQGQPLRLVHRDISPANIMVGWGGTTKVLDFGIASATAKDSRTTVGTIKGRIPYMSPEQLQGHELDGRSDLFSLAVVYYELIYGQRPFPADGMGALTLQILQQEPTPPPSIASKLPPRLRLILARALSKRPEDRWQSMRVFQRSLEQLLVEQKSDCTSYHVETYLQKLFPQKIQQPTPSTTAIPSEFSQEVSVSPSASTRENQPPIQPPQRLLKRGIVWGGALCIGLGVGIVGLYLANQPQRFVVKTTPVSTSSAKTPSPSPSLASPPADVPNVVLSVTPPTLLSPTVETPPSSLKEPIKPTKPVPSRETAARLPSQESSVLPTEPPRPLSQPTEWTVFPSGPAQNALSPPEPLPLPPSSPQSVEPPKEAVSSAKAIEPTPADKAGAAAPEQPSPEGNSPPTRPEEPVPNPAPPNHPDSVPSAVPESLAIEK